MISRDFQRSKVYRAEDRFAQYLDYTVVNHEMTICGSRLSLPPEAKFSTPETVQTYVDAVLALPAVVGSYGNSIVTVRERKGITKAHYRDGIIAVPDSKWALRESVILHELAHHFANSYPSHGPGFVSTFLNLVGAVMGAEAEFLLHMLFCDGEVVTHVKDSADAYHVTSQPVREIRKE